MAACSENIKILEVMEKKEVSDYRVGDPVMGMQQPNKEGIVCSGKMTGCHIVIGADANNKRKFFSHDNPVNSAIHKTREKIKEIGEGGKFYLFLTRKSLIEQCVLAPHGSDVTNEDIERCVANIKRLYNNVEFAEVYYLDDQSLDNVGVKFNFETGKLRAEGERDNFVKGKFETTLLSAFETTIPICANPVSNHTPGFFSLPFNSQAPTSILTDLNSRMKASLQPSNYEVLVDNFKVQYSQSIEEEHILSQPFRGMSAEVKKILSSSSFTQKTPRETWLDLIKYGDTKPNTRTAKVLRKMFDDGIDIYSGCEVIRTGPR